MNSHDESCQAFSVVAQAIRFIQANARAQPRLEEIAAHVGLSPFHLQRVFTTWAGISPKRFLQFLTRQHARTLLSASEDLLSVAAATGLSGPGRLHDLMIACDAATPGEISALGAGLAITYGYAATPFGKAIAGLTPRGLCHLHFVDAGMEQAAAEQLAADWSEARLVRDDASIAAVLETVFAPASEPRPTPLRVLLRGTNFQIKVWQALLAIPAGEAASYRTVARLCGVPGAQRAVGSAIAANRVAVLIPCHRVLRESGVVGEYRWGSERKCALLAYEAAARDGAYDAPAFAARR